MKKLLLTLMVLVTAFSALAKDIDETFESFTDAKATWLPTAQTATDQTFTSTITGLEWTVNNVMAAKSSGVIYMTFNKNGGYMSTTPGIACSKISVFVYQAGAKGELSIYADGDATAIGTAKTTSADIAAKENVFTFEIPEQYRNADTSFKIATSGNQTYIKYINFIEDESGNPSKQPCGLTLTPADAAYTVNLGETFTAPALSNPNGLAVTWTSSKPEVASVDASTGAVTLGTVADTTRITATTEGDETYDGGSVYYDLTVVDPNAPGTVNNPYTVAQALEACASKPTGVYAKGVVVSVKTIILPQNRTGSERKINPIKTLSEHGQQLKKKVFSGFQGQSSLGSAKRTDDAAGA